MTEEDRRIEAARLSEEVAFLTDEIRSLKSRIGANGNAPQLHKLAMLERLCARCERALMNIERMGGNERT